MTFNPTRCERVLGLAAILALLVFPARTWAQQLVAERPHVELGAGVAALARPGSSAIAATPRVSWNLDSQTAIDASADWHDRDGATGKVSSRIGYVQLKRSLFTSGSGRFFVTAGGAAGSSRSTYAPFSYRTSTGAVLVSPAQTSTRGLGGVSVGAGYDRVLGNHVIFDVESQMVFLGDTPIFRTFIGVSTSIGRYRRQPRASSQSPAALRDVRVGQTVWVTTSDGVIWKGIVADVSTSAIALGSNGTTNSLPLERVKRIEANDSIVDGVRRGALIGAASAGIPAVVAVAAICANEGGECASATFLYGLAWGGIGAGIGAVAGAIADSFHEGRRTVFEGTPARVTVTPVIAPHAAGFGAVIRW